MTQWLSLILRSMLGTLHIPTNLAWGIWPTRQWAGTSRNAMTRKAAAAGVETTPACHGLLQWQRAAATPIIWPLQSMPPRPRTLWVPTLLYLSSCRTLWSQEFQNHLLQIIPECGKKNSWSPMKLAVEIMSFLHCWNMVLNDQNQRGEYNVLV